MAPGASVPGVGGPDRGAAGGRRDPEARGLAADRGRAGRGVRDGQRCAIRPDPLRHRRGRHPRPAAVRPGLPLGGEPLPDVPVRTLGAGSVRPRERPPRRPGEPRRPPRDLARVGRSCAPARAPDLVSRPHRPRIRHGLRRLLDALRAAGGRFDTGRSQRHRAGDGAARDLARGAPASVGRTGDRIPVHGEVPFPVRLLGRRRGIRPVAVDRTGHLRGRLRRAQRLGRVALGERDGVAPFRSTADPGRLLDQRVRGIDPPACRAAVPRPGGGPGSGAPGGPGMGPSPEVVRGPCRGAPHGSRGPRGPAVHAELRGLAPAGRPARSELRAVALPARRAGGGGQRARPSGVHERGRMRSFRSARRAVRARARPPAGPDPPARARMADTSRPSRAVADPGGRAGPIRQLPLGPPG